MSVFICLFIHIIYVIYHICLRTSYPQMAKSLSFPPGVPRDFFITSPKPCIGMVSIRWNLSHEIKCWLCFMKHPGWTGGI